MNEVKVNGQWNLVEVQYVSIWLYVSRYSSIHLAFKYNILFQFYSIHDLETYEQVLSHFNIF